jgi:hypothetical protein
MVSDNARKLTKIDESVGRAMLHGKPELVEPTVSDIFRKMHGKDRQTIAQVLLHKANRDTLPAAKPYYEHAYNHAKKLMESSP